MTKAVIGLIRNLALCPINHSELREENTIPKLNQLLNKARAILVEQQQQPNLDEDSSLLMNEIIEGSLAALHLLAKDSVNRSIIRELGIIPVCVDLLYVDNENIQRFAAGLLCELVNDKEGAELIARENADVPLANLLNSRNEALTSFCAAILFRLSDGKWEFPTDMNMHQISMPEEVYTTNVYGHVPTMDNIYQVIDHQIIDPYGQITHLQQPNSNLQPQNQSWYDSDL